MHKLFCMIPTRIIGNISSATSLNHSYKVVGTKRIVSFLRISTAVTMTSTAVTPVEAYMAHA